MAERIPGGIISPSIEDGVIIWCKGDTFTLNIQLELYAMGESLELAAESSVEVSFRDRSGYTVKIFYANVEKGNCISLVFDEETSSAFDEGRYTFDVSVTDPAGSRTTVVKDSVAVVI